MVHIEAATCTWCNAPQRSICTNVTGDMAFVRPAVVSDRAQKIKSIRKIVVLLFRYRVYCVCNKYIS